MVYPASANLGTLTSELVRKLGRTCAVRHAWFKARNGKSTVCVALMCCPFGNVTSLSDGPFADNLSASRTKCEVAPESSTMLRPGVDCSRLLPLCPHLCRSHARNIVLKLLFFCFAVSATGKVSAKAVSACDSFGSVLTPKASSSLSLSSASGAQ